MSSKPYRWLGSPRERQHVFLGDSRVALCQMNFRTPEHVRRPQDLWCGWCRRQLKHLIESRRVEPEESP